MKSVNPYLNFNGQTEEAFKFYRSVFGGVLEINRYKNLDDNMGAKGEDLNLVANASLPMTGDIKLFGSDSLDFMGKTLESGNNFYINLGTESEEESKRLFEQLSVDGEIEMPSENTSWAVKFGMVKDLFGTQWMIYYTG